jgi:hypothetical protein
MSAARPAPSGTAPAPRAPRITRLPQGAMARRARVRNALAQPRVRAAPAAPLQGVRRAQEVQGAIDASRRSTVQRPVPGSLHRGSAHRAARTGAHPLTRHLARSFARKFARHSIAARGPGRLHGVRAHQPAHRPCRPATAGYRVAQPPEARPRRQKNDSADAVPPDLLRRRHARGRLFLRRARRAAAHARGGAAASPSASCRKSMPLPASPAAASPRWPTRTTATRLFGRVRAPLPQAQRPGRARLGRAALAVQLVCKLAQRPPTGAPNSRPTTTTRSSSAARPSPTCSASPRPPPPSPAPTFRPARAFRSGRNTST